MEFLALIGFVFLLGTVAVAGAKVINFVIETNSELKDHEQSLRAQAREIDSLRQEVITIKQVQRTKAK